MLSEPRIIPPSRSVRLTSIINIEAIFIDSTIWARLAGITPADKRGAGKEACHGFSSCCCVAVVVLGSWPEAIFLNLE